MPNYTPIFDRRDPAGLLSELLALARKGEIKAVAVVALTDDGGITGVSRTTSRLTLAGAIHGLSVSYSQWAFLDPDKDPLP